MKKARMKRSLALLLAIVMCIGLLPMGALAAQDGQDGIAVDATEDAGLAVQPDGSSEDSEEPNNPSENLDESNSISSEDSEESNDISSEEAEESNSPSEESDSVSSKETEEPAPIDEDGSTVTDAGVWKLSTFGSDAEKEDTGNWLTGSEDGFVLDYGKLYTENDNVGNVVVYDSGAEDLEDSTLEFDYKLEAEADDAKIQFGIFPRFQSGRNCDGLAIGEAAQIQHSYQVNGSEGWPGASNLPNMTFVKDTTYHFKIVTVGNTLTAYVDDTMLTTFTTNSAITNGGYGFRIWGQPNTGNHKKNVTVSNLTRKKCITSTLGSKGVNLKEAEWGSEDVTIPVTFGEGDSVKSISNGTSELTLNTDYAVGANSITIKKEYIEKQADSFTLTVNFTEGSSGEFTVTKLKTSENLELLHYYNATVRGIHMMLHNAFDRAVKERLILRNPTEDCIIPKLEKQEMKILRSEDMKAYLQAAEGRGVLPMFYLELVTGLRKGELAALLWDDLDTVNNTISVSKQLTHDKDGNLTVSRPKTETSIRQVSIPQEAVDLLIQEHEKHPDSPYLFPSPLTGQAYHPDSIVNLHKKILKDANLPHIRFHDLRHTFATMALQNGVDVKTVSTMLGHYDAGFTLRTYTHATRQKQDEAAQTMGSFMAQVM